MDVHPNHCGTNFLVPGATHSGRKYCNLSCRRSHLNATTLTGPNNPRWRGERPKRPAKREIRRLKQLARAAEAKARRRDRQRRAADLHARGLSLRQIARELVVSHEIVNPWLNGEHTVGEPAAGYRVDRASWPLLS
ncbi:MAG: hypothetical protein ACRDHY_17590 [Anaerolineales bacterium]